MAMKACLFDMDGLLINTEDMYTEATNRVLARYNKGPLPWSVKVNLQGRPGPKAGELLLQWAQLPIDVDELVKQTNEEQTKLWPKTEFLPGVKELLLYLHAKHIPIALATSSTKEKYAKKTGHLRDIFDLFGKHVITGDDPRIPPGRGKPAPDIFLLALESINVERRAAGEPDIKPSETLVFEDGVPGVESGQAAGCTVIWAPHPELAKMFGKEKMDEVIGKGKGEYVKSLADFDKGKYGL